MLVVLAQNSTREGERGTNSEPVPNSQVFLAQRPYKATGEKDNSVCELKYIISYIGKKVQGIYHIISSTVSFARR